MELDLVKQAETGLRSEGENPTSVQRMLRFRDCTDAELEAMERSLIQRSKTPLTSLESSALAGANFCAAGDITQEIRRRKVARN